MGKLSNKQRVFIEEYLTCWDAAKAARRAGYSPKTARFIGCENLTKPNVKAAIEQRIKEKAMSADEVILRLAEHARHDIGDLMNDEGVIANLFYRKATELPGGRAKVFASFTNTNIYWRSTKMMLKDYVQKNPGDAKALAAILNESTLGKLSDKEILSYLGDCPGVREFLTSRNAAKTTTAAPSDVSDGSSASDAGVTVQSSTNGPKNPFTGGR